MSVEEMCFLFIELRIWRNSGSESLIRWSSPARSKEVLLQSSVPANALCQTLKGIGRTTICSRYKRRKRHSSQMFALVEVQESERLWQIGRAHV